MKRIAMAMVSAVLLAATGCGKPAQIGADEETHKAVDALFTALTARDPKRLDHCENRLDELKAAGKLPDGAHAAIRKIIARAREGEWESASQRLYDFIKGQETGPATASKPKPAAKKK